MDSKKTFKSTSRKLERYRSAQCLNCGHSLDLTDIYCPSCSQLNSTKQLSIKDFFGEFLSSIFTYDSRLRFTLKDPLLKPGIISKNYVKGQRLKYANPFRFFLSVSITYFILQSIGASLNLENNSSVVNNVTVDGVPVEISESKSLMETIDSINKEKETAIEINNNDSIFEKNKKRSESTIYLTESDLETIQWSKRIGERFFQYRKFYKETEIKDPIKALDSIGHENSSFNRWVYNKNRSMDRIVENPISFANYLFGKIPFFLFLFAPFFAFFFWLLYSRKKYNFMEHLVFIFHIFSFVFLIMLISYIPDLIIGSEVFLAISLLIIGPFYFYRALRKFYEQSHLLTIFKFVLLNIIFFASANVSALLFFLATAAVY